MKNKKNCEYWEEEMYKPDYLMMTAGPTMVRKNVMKARSEFCGNPDLDSEFFDFYEKLCCKVGKIYGVKDEKVLIMNGEGMLGLDAACVSLTEEGDKVLVIANGIFGKGFKDLVELYGGIVTLYEESSKEQINIEKLSNFLKEKSDYKYATVVHCDTPTGVLNNVGDICKLLKSYGILTVVDTVAAVGGVSLDVNDNKIDIALGASQKVFSSTSGLSVLTISEDAWRVMEDRKTPIKSYYANILLWKNCVEEKYFPYTMPASDLLGLDMAVDNMLVEGVINIYERHEEVSKYARDELVKMGLKLYLANSFSPTATAFYIPNNFTDIEIMKKLKDEYRILIAGSYGEFKGKLLRIGHMGENCTKERVQQTLKALKKIIS